MDIRIQCLCIDTGDPAKIASFWESALGWRRTFEEEGEVVLEPPEGSREDGVVPDLLFLKVPEGKVAKSRVHLDVRAAPGCGARSGWRPLEQQCGRRFHRDGRAGGQRVLPGLTSDHEIWAWVVLPARADMFDADYRQ